MVTLLRHLFRPTHCTLHRGIRGRPSSCDKVSNGWLRRGPDWRQMTLSTSPIGWSWEDCFGSTGTWVGNILSMTGARSGLSTGTGPQGAGKRVHEGFNQTWGGVEPCLD